jgi:hypothetical protein
MTRLRDDPGLIKPVARMDAPSRASSCSSYSPLELSVGKLSPLSAGPMQANATHPISENELYLKLFITNGGGW